MASYDRKYNVRPSGNIGRRDIDILSFGSLSISWRFHRALRSLLTFQTLCLKYGKR